MPGAFTLRIFVPEGDPNGVRVVERMNWTGRVTVIPRDRWPQMRDREELRRAGVYILFGYDEAPTELPSIYVGEAEVVRQRIDQHVRQLAFWDRVVVLTAGVHLNKAHVKWLEATLVERAKQAGRSVVTNPGGTRRAHVSEAEEADLEAFVAEALAILPLVELRVFEARGPVVVPGQPAADAVHPNAGLDTLVVPAQADGFTRVFIGQHEWFAVRIGRAMLSQIRYIAAYQTQPVSAVTHYAPVQHIEPYGVDGKYKVVCAEAPTALPTPIPLGDAPSGSLQSPRYTSFGRLTTARSVRDLF